MKSVTGNRIHLSTSPDAASTWSFLTKHGRVLLSVAHDPQMRLRDIAADVELTERRVHAILGELIDSGYVVKVKTGRRNRYEINGQLPVPDIATRARPISEVLRLLTPESPS